jgi:hypothetical protein
MYGKEKNSIKKNIWNKDNAYVKGIPRPFFSIPKSLQFKEKLNGAKTRYLAAMVPVPWQSIPVFNSDSLLKVEVKNEQEAVQNQLCGYCGIGFQDEEESVLWVSQLKKPTHDGLKSPLVYTDFYPLHPACMKDARTFCPFMRNLVDAEFVYGKYKDLYNIAKDRLKNSEFM